MQHLYVSDLQQILLGLETLAAANSGGTEDSKALIVKIKEVLKEEEESLNRD